jgi:hypothetical protein
MDEGRVLMSIKYSVRKLIWRLDDAYRNLDARMRGLTIADMAREALIDQRRRIRARNLAWLKRTFGKTVDDFLEEDFVIRLGYSGGAPGPWVSNGLQIRLAGGNWSETILSYTDLGRFLEKRPPLDSATAEGWTSADACPCDKGWREDR